MGPTNAFLHAATGFPAVLFGAALVVVLCFWLAVLAGAAEPEEFDTDLDTSSTGFDGVPVSVSVSLLVVVAWGTSLTGTLMLHHSGTTGGTRAVLALAVLAGSLLVPWVAVSAALPRIAAGAATPGAEENAATAAISRAEVSIATSPSEENAATPRPVPTHPVVPSPPAPTRPVATPHSPTPHSPTPHTPAHHAPAPSRVRLLHGSADAIGPLRIAPRSTDGPHREPSYDADGLFRVSPYDAYRDAGPAARPRPAPHPHRSGPHSRPVPHSPRTPRPGR